MAKFLVTGAAGFIGFHTVNKLINNGHIVIGLDNINNYYDLNLKYARLEETGISKDIMQNGERINSQKFENYSFIKLDLEDSIQINNLFKKERFDFVVHLAAQAGVRYSLTNP